VFWIQSLLFWQLQALFTLFSECFCIFPSRYLCTIGLLPSILALDGVYHLDSGCVPKQPYSEKKRKERPGQQWFFSEFPQRKYKKNGAFCIVEDSKGEQKKKIKEEKKKRREKKKRKKEEKTSLGNRERRGKEKTMGRIKEVFTSSESDCRLNKRGYHPLWRLIPKNCSLECQLCERASTPPKKNLFFFSLSPFFLAGIFLLLFPFFYFFSFVSFGNIHLYLHIWSPPKRYWLLSQKPFLYFFANTAWLLATLHPNPFM